MRWSRARPPISTAGFSAAARKTRAGIDSDRQYGPETEWPRWHVRCDDPREPFRKGTIMTPDIKRILVPLDFSATSTRALDYAHGMAFEFNAVIHLVHVCEVPSMLTASMDAYALAYTDWSQRLGEEANAQLMREAARLTGVP